MAGKYNLKDSKSFHSSFMGKGDYVYFIPSNLEEINAFFDGKDFSMKQLKEIVNYQKDFLGIYQITNELKLGNSFELIKLRRGSGLVDLVQGKIILPPTEKMLVTNLRGNSVLTLVKAELDIPSSFSLRRLKKRVKNSKYHLDLIKGAIF